MIDMIEISPPILSFFECLATTVGHLFSRKNSIIISNKQK